MSIFVQVRLVSISYFLVLSWRDCLFYLSFGFLSLTVLEIQLIFMCCFVSCNFTECVYSFRKLIGHTAQLLSRVHCHHVTSLLRIWVFFFYISLCCPVVSPRALKKMTFLFMCMCACICITGGLRRCWVLWSWNSRWLWTACSEIWELNVCRSKCSYKSSQLSCLSTGTFNRSVEWKCQSSYTVVPRVRKSTQFFLNTTLVKDIFHVRHLLFLLLRTFTLCVAFFFFFFLIRGDNFKKVLFCKK